MTEAGEGEDARIKSAIGIGSLLADGIGDTVRVSLTEDSPHEIPVAKALIENIRNTSNAAHRASNVDLSFDPFSYQRRATEKIERDGVKLGGDELIRVVVRQANFDKVAHKIDRMGDYKPEIVYETAQIQEVDPRDENAIAKINAERSAQFVTVTDEIDLPVIAAFRLLSAKLHARHPILLKDMLVGAADLNGPGRLGSIAPTPDFLRDSCSLPPPTSAHCYATASATRSWCKARKRRDKRSVCPTTSCRQPAREFSRQIMSRARRADGRCSICKPQRRKSKQPPCI